jgi:Flp pilus assembly pilin Flp
MNRLNESGNAYIEYFILALVVALATLVFFQNGGFGQMRTNIETAFSDSVTEMLRP